ncbi:MAG: heme ABC transporter substrate-binding protein IsdE [Clostridiales Family XIII bacterium]|jgi:iron complex transport system substrate-binding protein|nr:heme ABC transporter substrate-binding protein IsdE [Clostridiales Family XIII bacterium]
MIKKPPFKAPSKTTRATEGLCQRNKTKRIRVCALLFAAGLCLSGLAGCVDRPPEAAGENAADGAGADENPRIVATSRAVVEICDRLELPLAGVPTLEGLPARYDEAARVGGPMGPDLEAIRLIDPIDVVGPDTLIDMLAEGYENAGLPATFLNLRSVAGLYESAEILGGKYGRADAARALTEEYKAVLADIEAARQEAGGEAPRVLVLMGLPGAYVEATQNSYVGNLAEMVGGVNVVTDPVEDFVSWNTEELLLLDPDIILRTAHALPDKVAEMFLKEFTENDIWSHFRAVKEGRVYDLDYLVFSMSANFRWPEAMDALKEIYYDKDAQ